MIDGVQLKVCGITSLVDAEWADKAGADYVGIIFYPASPRFVSLAQYQAMADRMPERRQVAVSVEPSVADLRAQDAAGFDRFQVHFRPEAAADRVKAWADAVGRNRLWLAPKLPPGTPVPAELLLLADVFLLDGYKSGQFGGTGRTADWYEYRRLRQEHRDKTWILSGGLTPENIGPALAATDARFVDVNSGVESAPGVKDLAKLKAFVVALHRARTEKQR